MIAMTLGDIAEKIQAELQGDPNCRVDRVQSLEKAELGSITFLANTHYQCHLANTKASAVILSEKHKAQCPTNALIVADPEFAWTQLLTIGYPPSKATPGIHATAVIGENCQIDPTATIGPHCVIEAGTVIGARTQIGASCVISAGAHIGADNQLWSRVTVYAGVQLGDRVIVHSGAVLGADGFGLAHHQDHWVKIPQIGGLIIGDDVEIGANTTIDRGALEDTLIGEGVKIDNLVQIAHNVRIGAHTAIAGCAGVAGSAEIGQHCMIGGGACINGHLKITDGVIIGGTGSVAQSIVEPGFYASSIPVQKNSVWLRNMLRLQHLDEMAKRLSRLEKQAAIGEGHYE